MVRQSGRPGRRTAVLPNEPTDASRTSFMPDARNGPSDVRRNATTSASAELAQVAHRADPLRGRPGTGPAHPLTSATRRGSNDVNGFASRVPRSETDGHL